VLGELGRIWLQELEDGRCHISCEVVGDPSDPITTQRTAIFKPLGLELTHQMEAAFGATPEETGPVDPPARPLEAKEVIESKIIPCERCGSVVAMLIFAPNASDPGRFEDVADTGAMPTVGSCAIQSAPRSGCYKEGIVVNAVAGLGRGRNQSRRPRSPGSCPLF
jgi:hypothetical protein